MILRYDNEIYLVEMAKKYFLGIEKLNILKYFDCHLLGKQHSVDFRVGMPNSRIPFGYVYSDI